MFHVKQTVSNWDRLLTTAAGSVLLDREGEPAELNDLYSQKAQAESEWGSIAAQKNSAQEKVNARKQELVQNRQDGEKFAAENEDLSSLQEAYEQTVSARGEAQQELNRVR